MHSNCPFCLLLLLFREGLLILLPLVVAIAAAAAAVATVEESSSAEESSATVSVPQSASLLQPIETPQPSILSAGCTVYSRMFTGVTVTVQLSSAQFSGCLWELL